MENIVLGFVLFCVYFCTMSCFFYSGQARSIATETEAEPIEKQVREMFRMIDEDGADELSEDEPPQRAVIEEITNQDLIEALNLEKLTLRKARPVAKALDIRQKVNGKDAPVKWLRVQIKQRLEEKPDLLPVVYEVLEVPFPATKRIEKLSA